jgi:hemolysin III
MAILGLVLKVTGVMRHPRLSTGFYLAMGWLIVIAIRPLWLKVPLPGILWLLAGGLAYTGGVAFYAAERVRYSHSCGIFSSFWVPRATSLRYFGMRSDLSLILISRGSFITVPVILCGAVDLCHVNHSVRP